MAVIRRGKTLKVAVIRAGRYRTTLAPGCAGCASKSASERVPEGGSPAADPMSLANEYLKVYKASLADAKPTDAAFTAE